MIASRLPSSSNSKNQTRKTLSHKQNLLRICALAGLLSLSWHAQAQTPNNATQQISTVNSPSQDQVRANALLKRAVTRYEQVGDKAFADFMQSRKFNDGELYVFVIDTKGEMLVSGGPSSALIHQNVSDLRDAQGKPFMAEILDKSKSALTGNVSYKWLNRVDNRVETKITNFEKVGDRIIAVGYYIAHATPVQAEALLKRASNALRTDPIKTLSAINRPHSVYSEDDLYVFVINLKENRFVAHGLDRRLVGSDAMSLLDATGKPIVQQMKVATAKQDHAEIEYRWPNPVTGMIEQKHTLLQKVGEYLLGVGYYQQ